MKKLSILLAVCSLFLACQDEQTITDAYGRITNLKDIDALKRECLLYKEQLIGNHESVIKLGKDTSVPGQYFKIRLYPSLSRDKITQMEKEYKFSIPEDYELFLSQINGAFINDIALYGLPDTGVQPAMVDRNELQALNVYTANSIWKYEHAIDPTCFLFGSSPFDSTENKHYLMKNDSIYSSRENGYILNRWASLNEMLEFELKHQK